jgi:hypothetical protein
MQPSEPSAARDRALGMDRPIARRNFLNALALGAALARPAFAEAESAKRWRSPAEAFHRQIPQCREMDLAHGPWHVP